MYVQIDKHMRDSLQGNVIAKMYMGSHAHGLADEDSDEDILYVYYDMEHGHTIFNETNGWQYKNGNVDENYQELRVFISNLITAKMCGNLEALLDGWTFNDQNINRECELALDVIFKRLRDIRSYALIKSYLGYAKKDIKNARKMLAEDCPLDSRDLRKKIVHIIRGIDTVAYLLHQERYSFTRKSQSLIKDFAIQTKRCRNLLIRETIDGLLNSNEEAVNKMRDQANKQLESHGLYRRGEPCHLRSINSMLTAFVQDVDDEFDRIDYDEDLRMNILEKGESHQYI